MGPRHRSGTERGELLLAALAVRAAEHDQRAGPLVPRPERAQGRGRADERRRGRPSPACGEPGRPAYDGLGDRVARRSSGPRDARRSSASGRPARTAASAQVEAYHAPPHAGEVVEEAPRAGSRAGPRPRPARPRWRSTSASKNSPKCCDRERSSGGRAGSPRPPSSAARRTRRHAARGWWRRRTAPGGGCRRPVGRRAPSRRWNSSESRTASSQRAAEQTRPTISREVARWSSSR